MSKRVNYFNTLSQRAKLDQLARCRFMARSEFSNGIAKIADKKIVIVGCGAQGLNQGLNMRDSGCDISYTLRQSAIDAKRASYVNATTNGFKVGTYEELIPTADLVLNLTPDKQHSSVVNAVMPLMKKGATLAYSHGFNIVEEGMQVRPDLTVAMVAPNALARRCARSTSAALACRRVAVHPENDPKRRPRDCEGVRGSDRRRPRGCPRVVLCRGGQWTGGEQTILCGMLQVRCAACDFVEPPFFPLASC